MNTQSKVSDGDDDVAWVAIELQKKALHRLLYRMDQDDKKIRYSRSSSSSDDCSDAVAATGAFNNRIMNNKSKRESGNTNIRKSFTIMESESSLENENDLLNHQKNNDREKMDNHLIEKDFNNNQQSIWMKIMIWIHKIVKSPKILKSLGWISVTSLATISLLKFLGIFMSLLFNSHTNNQPYSANNTLMREEKNQQMPSHLIPPPIFQSIDDDIPRSVKGRFYLHELSTLQEQFENDGVYGSISTSGSSPTRSHLKEGPLFIPITNIEQFQEKRQQTKYKTTSDIDEEINKNGLFGQMVQLESFRKSSLFSGD